MDDRGTKNGIYLQAFAAGLQKILKPYQQILVRLEGEVSLKINHCLVGFNI